MGVTNLWKLLTEEGVVRRLSGSDPSQHAALLSELDDSAVAVDLSAWIMQADQQLALLPHFSRTERCMKVALERSTQWLRHGVVPVIVVEGKPPAEKLATVQARFAARNGHDGGGRGSASFLSLGKAVGILLQQLGLPVFYAPGEAEATCAALARASAVHACASFDSDTLVYGAERVYHTLKLSTMRPGECEAVCCDLADIRRALGIRKGGASSLSIIAMLAGSDYDQGGTAGVGSIASLKLLRHLLGPDAEDDSGVLAALEALVARPPSAELAALTKCTGCRRCGHEGGRKGAVAHHTVKNPCACCETEVGQAEGAEATGAKAEAPDGGPASLQRCAARRFTRCGCAFHTREAERGAEAVAARVRADAAPLAAARRAAAVFGRQASAADVYVAGRCAELGCAPGQRLQWLRRPSTLGVWGELERRRQRLTWDLPTLRGKLLPLLLEWDLARAGSGEGEFVAREVQKVQGGGGRSGAGRGGSGGGARSGDGAAAARGGVQAGVSGGRAAAGAASAPPTGWRYVVRWERRPDAACEAYPELLVRGKERRGAAPRTGADPGAACGEGGGERGASQGGTPRQDPGAEEVPATPMTVQAYDSQWLEGCAAEARSVRVTAVHRHAPDLERRFLAGCGPKSGGRGRKPAPPSPGTKGLLDRLLVQQRARALLGPKAPAGPVLARPREWGLFSVPPPQGDDGAATAPAGPAPGGPGPGRGPSPARGRTVLRPGAAGPTKVALSPKKRALVGGAGADGAAAAGPGASNQATPQRRGNDIRRYVERGSPARESLSSGSTLDLTTPESHAPSPAIDLTLS